MSPPASVVDPSADAVRAAGLRRMRLVAGSLLLLAAVVYVLTRDQAGLLGFVNAGAEASMVGAIADWFAVTALFRHPLGLPVPHTALIPRRKDELGRGLEEFVSENFLAEPVVRERLAAAQVSRRVGVWLARPGQARRLVDEAAEVAATALGRVRDEHVASLVNDALVPRFREEPISPLLGGVLGEVLADRVHTGLVDVVLGELHDWLVENPDTVTELLGERAPWWAPQSVNERVSVRIHAEMVRWVGDIRDDPYHRARYALDTMLARLADDLLTEGSETAARTEALKDRLLDHPAVISTAISLWDALRRALTGSLADPEGAVRVRLLTEVERFGARLRTEPALRERLDGLAADAAVFAISRYGAEAASVITATVEAWDGDEAARRIELHVGRDLQFIRINGTIVGGLVGVVIHAVAVLVP